MVFQTVEKKGLQMVAVRADWLVPSKGPRKAEQMADQ